LPSKKYARWYSLRLSKILTLKLNDRVKEKKGTKRDRQRKEERERRGEGKKIEADENNAKE